MTPSTNPQLPELTDGTNPPVQVNANGYIIVSLQDPQTEVLVKLITDYELAGITIEQQLEPIPPEGCICASFWTVRQAHKTACPLAGQQPKPADKVNPGVGKLTEVEHDAGKTAISVNLLPTGVGVQQPEDDELRELLIDAVDDRRFDDGFPAKILYKDIEYVIDLILPKVTAYAGRRADKREVSNMSADRTELMKILNANWQHQDDLADALTAWADKRVEEAELKGEIAGHYEAAADLGELDTVSRDGSYWLEHKKAADYIVGYAKELEKELAEFRAAHSSREGGMTDKEYWQVYCISCHNEGLDGTMVE